jgi:hypothetical protein
MAQAGSHTIAAIGILVCLLGFAWAVIKPRISPSEPEGQVCWHITYVDANGELVFTTIHVLSVDPDGRHLTAWCGTTQRERRFKLGMIAKATDLATGRPVKLLNWLNKAGVPAGREGRHSHALH